MTNSNLHLDGLLVTRAMDELNVHVTAGDKFATSAKVSAVRAAAERNVEQAIGSGDVTPCTNTHGDGPDALLCERDAGHDGPCAALVLFPAPKPTT